MVADGGTLVKCRRTDPVVTGPSLGDAFCFLFEWHVLGVPGAEIPRNSSVDFAGRSYSQSMGLVRDIVFYRMTILTSDGVIFVHAKVSSTMCVRQPGGVIYFFAPGR